MEEMLEFIDRCKAVLHEEIKLIEKHNYNSQWRNQNPDKRRQCINKYSKTDKGRYAASKRNAKRQKFFTAACEGLSLEEKLEIGKFYRNCPEGYEVDHIIPVSFGVKHKMDNLQYLTKEENRYKGNRTENYEF